MWTVRLWVVGLAVDLRTMDAFVRDVEACEWHIFVECIWGNYHPVISTRMSIEQQQHIMEICWCGAVILLLLCWTFRRTDAAVVLLIIENARTFVRMFTLKWKFMKMYINEFVTVIIFFFQENQQFCWCFTYTTLFS